MQNRLAAPALRAAALALVLAALVGCATSPTAPEAARSDAPLPGESATLVVHGLSCPLCANNLDKQLLAVDGVESVQVDLGTGAVAVRFPGSAKPSEAALATAVQRAGFTLQSINTP